MNIQDPYGLIEQMFPRFWGPEKRRQVKQLPRINQIQEIQKHRQAEGQYEELSLEKVEQIVRHIYNGVEPFIEQAGEHWFRVRVGKLSFYTDKAGLSQLDSALRERHKD